ncbi:hypothetical protein OSB04_012021 [Centaurea solstitialis]|uniref:HAT C-terminal dimerisation domain-containing protein n=1 Tax=Centaurea solstitialis TaxID=347529 RepID=A0AA38WDJ8_9ASTR|nr:hypothetical protein OSB04_012021 [Centaurea solstitialis]
MATSENENVDIGCDVMEGNEKDHTTCHDTNESISTPIRLLSSSVVADWLSLEGYEDVFTRLSKKDKHYVSLPSKEEWIMVSETMMSRDDMFETIELDHYLAKKPLPNKEVFDILVWWKYYGAKFPILQTTTTDVLAIPISTVALEPTFSMGGNKITKQCSRLKSKTIESLMYAQRWLRKEIQDKKTEKRRI